MERKKSLCESCSNNVVIKYHHEDIKPGMEEKGCFYDFSVYAILKRNNNHERIHVGNIIVDECSFYNKQATIRLKNKIKEKIEGDDSDSDTNITGVTFVNIPGALLP